MAIKFARQSARRLACAGALALGASLSAPMAMAKDWAIVVGIDDYQFFQPFDPNHPVFGVHTDLQGAVNDATVVADAFRAIGVDLPDGHFLTNSSATLANFLAAWSNVTRQAQPGDRVFVTYAGHGGQEREVSAPLDEADGLDETLMFHDFNPNHPREGRLNDDQLRAMLETVPQLQIIWVMDSCHSGGLERSINPRAAGLSRSGGVWDIPVDPIPTEAPSGQGDTGKAELPNVTQILATATDDRLVQETAFDGQPHGALSWFFAKAIAGEADLNGDGTLTRLEISSYIGDRVFTHMEQNQQPRFLPRGDPSVMLSLHASSAAEPIAPVIAPAVTQAAVQVDQPQQATGLPIRILGAPPPGLDSGVCPGCRVVEQGQSILFEQVQGGWAVYSGQGDLVTVITGDARPQLARMQFLGDFDRAKVASLPPVVLRPQQSAQRQPIGTNVGFEFPPPAPELNFLTLFNLASDGTVQYGIYPPGFRESQPSDEGTLLRFSVAPPTGEDQLIAVWCSRPPLPLQALLAQANGQVVPPLAEILAATADVRCQFGRIGLFTEG
ncbi:MAG: caspase family protein [Rhodobacteraceae bacterium]|nr:caspase family protein [Paracoccaceae bacterium]MCF8513967.1 caspase family protein [Paracoccaceae bacterium]MCF8518211.1 caspase family protein [Paracoccaceae bacterium]